MAIAAVMTQPLKQIEEIASAAVSFAVDSARASIASIVTGTTSTFTFSEVPIDLHLTDKIKSQTLQDEYIHFHQILPSNSENDPLALGVQSQNGQGRVVMMPNRQKKTLSFQDWCTAWNIFMSIYLAKPNQQSGLCRALAKHFDVVQGLARNNAGWRNYDGNFRLMVTKGLAQWGSVHAELLLEAKLEQTTTALKVNCASTRIPPDKVSHFILMVAAALGTTARKTTRVNCGGTHSAMSCGQCKRQTWSFCGQSMKA